MGGGSGRLRLTGGVMASARERERLRGREVPTGGDEVSVTHGHMLVVSEVGNGLG